MRQHKTILLGLVVALFASFPLSAVAGDRVSDRPSDRENQQPEEEVARDEAPAIAVTDLKVTDQKVTDRPTDEVRPTDHRPLDRCLHHADNPRRCVDHVTDDPINVRHLLWRLFRAQEWEKLVRLLIRLGLL